MSDDRPDPDALLARFRAEEAVTGRGALKIFFGYAAGVGKTYAMLDAARRAQAIGRDIVVGYVEPHGRRETEALLDGLEGLPTRQIEYRGVTLREFDIDAALDRKPALILVDELAHSNAEGSRHTKRWQDVDELLQAGIDVWTTLNVQHIDSLNDVIGRVTGVTIRETVPDGIFDLADDLELVDITPQELLDRLHAGKVYATEQAERAVQSFFQKSNLVALREFSFRHAARRVHTDVESERRARSVTDPWPTAERLLVCVGPSPTTARVVRTAKRMAQALDAPWMAVAVESIGMASSAAAKEQVAKHFRLAERLGAETVTLTGEDVAETLLDYVQTRNVTKILIGKTLRPRWKRYVTRTIVDDVLDRSGNVDVYVIQGQEDATPRGAASAAPSRARSTWRSFGLTAGVMAASSLVAGVFGPPRLAGGGTPAGPEHRRQAALRGGGAAGRQGQVRPVEPQLCRGAAHRLRVRPRGCRLCRGGVFQPDRARALRPGLRVAAQSRRAAGHAPAPDSGGDGLWRRERRVRLRLCEYAVRQRRDLAAAIAVWLRRGSRLALCRSLAPSLTASGLSR